MKNFMAVVCGLTALAACGGTSVWDVSVADFQALPGEKGDTARIQRAVAAAGADGVVWFPRGDYRLDAMLVVSNGASLLLHKSARLSPLHEMPFLLTYWAQVRSPAERLDHSLFIRGGVFDGAGLAGCVNLLGVRHFTFADSLFRDGRGVGLQVGDATLKNANGYELIANNLYFINRRADLAGNVALLTYVGDSHFTDIIAIDWTVGIRTYGGNRFTRCHTWGGLVRDASGVQTMLQDSIAFDVVGQAESVFDDCYADTAQTGFAIHAAARLLGCSYLNDYKSFKMDNVAVIRHYRGDLTVSDGRFRNDVRTPHAVFYVREEGLRGQDIRRLKWRDNCVYGFSDEGLADLRKTLATPSVPVDR